MKAQFLYKGSDTLLGFVELVVDSPDGDDVAGIPRTAPTHPNMGTVEFIYIVEGEG